jgi:hypothetical protein
MERSAIRDFYDTHRPRIALRSIRATKRVVYFCGPDSEMSRSARKTLL